MARITVDLDAAVLRELKQRQRREGRSLGALISELVTVALHEKRQALVPESFEWISRPLGALVDLEDKAALRSALAGE